MNETFLCLKDAVKKYGRGETEVYALDHAGLTVRKGETCPFIFLPRRLLFRLPAASPPQGGEGRFVHVFKR